MLFSKIKRAREINRTHGLSTALKAALAYVRDSIRNPVWSLFWNSRQESSQLAKNLVSLQWSQDGYTLSNDACGWCLSDGTGTAHYFPTLRDHSRFKPSNYEDLRTSYYESELCSLSSEDTVIDVGAYVGVSTRLAANIAAEVYAVEPSPRAAECLKNNTYGYNNVTVVEQAAWSEESSLDLQLGGEPSEDSLLTPDVPGDGSVVTVEANTIAEIASDYGIETIDFLKIEAEGAEPEVVDGIDGIKVRKLAVRGDAEREGEETHQAVAKRLRDRGFEVTVDLAHKGNMVYARQTD